VTIVGISFPFDLEGDRPARERTGRHF